MVAVTLEKIFSLESGKHRAKGHRLSSLQGQHATPDLAYKPSSKVRFGAAKPVKKYYGGYKP